MSTCGVYEIVVKHTGERYIGSSVDLRRRERHHRLDLEKNKHRNATLQAAYQGPDSIEFRILEECDKTVVRQREQHHMDTAECINTIRNCLSDPTEISEERKRKIGAAHRGKKLSAEHKANLSAARKGKSNSWLKGKPLSAAHKAKLSAASKAKLSKPVYVKWADGTEMTYSSVKDASKAIGVSHAVIGRWARGERTTYTKRGITEIKYV